ncbi:FKBP-type peptidyl-prolyl cis-trans isomerase [Candidatus Hydrogenedentota bacterium]
MKVLATTLAVAILCVSVSAMPSDAKTGDKLELKTFSQKVSYMIGMDLGTNLKTLPAEIDFEILLKAAQAASKGEDLLMTLEEARAVQMELMEKVQTAKKKAGKKNKTEGEAFLAKNKKKKGVITTESGLQYEVLKEGNGPKPKATDKVTVHYKGTLIDGAEFDSSYKRGEPASFPLNGVIKGWTEGLQLMKSGAKYRFHIPSELAYGARGGGPLIGPDAVLIFDVELISIDSK